jgi:hypothetical protein
VETFNGMLASLRLVAYSDCGVGSTSLVLILCCILITNELGMFLGENLGGFLGKREETSLDLSIIFW